MRTEDLVGLKVAYLYNGTWHRVKLTSDIVKQINNFKLDHYVMTLATVNHGLISLEYDTVDQLWRSSDLEWQELIIDAIGEPDINLDTIESISDVSISHQSLGPVAMNTEDYNGAFFGGSITKRSAVDLTLGSAFEVIDGDDSTYEEIGTNGVRYIVHDFGGSLNRSLTVSSISWIVESAIDKTYAIEYYDGEAWVRLEPQADIDGEEAQTEYTTGPGGENITRVYDFGDNPADMYAVRIYYTGNFSTNTSSVELTISAKDDGSGVKEYRVSNFGNFRDDPEWQSFNGGIIIRDWDILPPSDAWDIKFELPNIDFPEANTITAMIAKDTTLIVGTENGKVYYSENGEENSWNLSSTVLSSKINVFAIYGDDDSQLIYAGCDNGDVYISLNGVSWDLAFNIGYTPLPGDTTVRNGIISMGVFNDRLFIGTDYNDLYYWSVFDSSTVPILTHKFNDRSISSIIQYGDDLFVATSPSGIIFSSPDGSNFTQMINTRLSEWGQGVIHSGDDFVYFFGDRGTIYRYATVSDGDSSPGGGNDPGTGGDGPGTGGDGPGTGGDGPGTGGDGPGTGGDGPGTGGDDPGGGGSIPIISSLAKMFAVDGSSTYEWLKWYDSASNKITSATSFTQVGPTIIDATSDAFGSPGLSAGRYIYTITYIDFDGIESIAGPEVTLEVPENAQVYLDWDLIEAADYYRVYRTASANQNETGIGILESELYETEYTDNGEASVDTTIAPPDSSLSFLWFGSDSGNMYVYDNSTIIFVNSPDDMQSIVSLQNYKSFLYVAGVNEDEDKSYVATYASAITGSGVKRVYLQVRDYAGNISTLASDDITYDTLLQNALIEVDRNGDIVQFYRSTSDPAQKIISPRKDVYQTGVWVSEPFFAATLSRWDQISYLACLEPGTEVDLYVRTGSTLQNMEASEFIKIQNIIDNDIEQFGYDYTYSDQDALGYDYYEIPNDCDFIFGQSTISTFRGKWIQFRAVLKTEIRGNTPRLFSVVLKYVSLEGSFFFSTLFDLDTFISAEGLDDTSSPLVRRALLTFNGAAPPGGDIQFGITTAPDSYRWQDYQIVTPNRVFELDPRSKQFRVGILLSSSAVDIAVVHEWALMFDSGTLDTHPMDYYTY